MHREGRKNFGDGLQLVEGDLSRRPKITRAELLSDGRRDELRDFPRGSNRKSVFWWLEFDRTNWLNSDKKREEFGSPSLNTIRVYVYRVSSLFSYFLNFPISFLLFLVCVSIIAWIKKHYLLNSKRVVRLLEKVEKKEYSFQKTIIRKMEKKRGKRKNTIKKKEEKQARKPCPTKAGPFPLKRSSSLYDTPLLRV